MGETFGQGRVNVVYKDDPAQKIHINKIRTHGADFIDAVDGMKEAIIANQETPLTSEQARLFALAFTAIEEAVMWSVKAVTK